MGAKHSVRSQTGTKKKKNDDFYLADEELGLYIVCDGVSGHEGASIASHEAIAVIRQLVLDNRSRIVKYIEDPTAINRKAITQLLHEGFLQASEKLIRQTRSEETKSQMATTAELLLIGSQYAYLAHIGDSRTYLLRDGKLHSLTVDHNYAMELVMKENVKPEEALKNKYAYALTRAIGSQQCSIPDTLEIELLPGDRFLMCTDGVTGVVPGGMLQERAVMPELDLGVEGILHLSLEKGSHDDITVMVVEPTGSISDKQVREVMSKIEVIRKVPLFQYFKYKELVRVLEIANLRRVPVGTTVLKDQVSSAELLIVLEGAVNIMKSGKNIATRGTGTVLGEMGLVDPLPSSADVATLEETLLLVFPKEGLFNMFRQDATLAVKFLWALAQVMSQRLRSVTAELATYKVLPKQRDDVLPFSRQ